MEYTCNVCQQIKDEKLFKYDHGKVQTSTCRKCLLNKFRLNLKLELFRELSSCCQCCGETNPAFLCLDHVNNDGHIEQLRIEKIVAQARKDGWDKKRYQVLCFNCNMAKSFFGGTCPHKLGIDRNYLENNQNQYITAMGRIVGNFDTSNLEAAREVLRQKRIALGHYGRDAATRSKEYRERHPEYKDRKKELRNLKDLSIIFTQEQIEQIRLLIPKN